MLRQPQSGNRTPSRSRRSRSVGQNANEKRAQMRRRLPLPVESDSSAQRHSSAAQPPLGGAAARWLGLLVAPQLGSPACSRWRHSSAAQPALGGAAARWLGLLVAPASPASPLSRHLGPSYRATRLRRLSWPCSMDLVALSRPRYYFVWCDACAPPGHPDLQILQRTRILIQGALPVETRHRTENCRGKLSRHK